MMFSFIKTLDEGMKSLVFNKFGGFLNLSNLTQDLIFAPKSIAQRQIAEKRGKSQLEFISIWRNPPEFSWDRHRTPVGRTGFLMEYLDESSKTAIVQLKAVPADIIYEVYFWSLSLDKLNKIVEDYLFWIHNKPEMSIYFNETYLMDLDLKFGPVVDESLLNEMYEKGKYFVYKLTITLESWIIDATTLPTILTVYMNIYDNSKILLASHTITGE